MIAVISTILSILLLLFSNSAAAAISNFLCRDQAQFNCYTVKRHDTWEKLFGNPQKRDMVKRINRMNTSLVRGMKIAIPKDLANATSYDFAPFPKQIDPPGEKKIIVSVNPTVLAWGAYDKEGTLQAWGPASGGQGWCPDLHRGCHTTLGLFKIYRKEGSGCASSKFPIPRGGAPMPYCMYYHGGYALHGSYHVPGYNASHGCVRILIPDAKWLNQEFVMHDKVAVEITELPARQ